MTPSYRRRTILRSLGEAACLAVGLPSGLVIATSGHLDYVAPAFWAGLVVMVAGGAFGWVIMPGPKALAVSRVGIAYDSSEFGLATPWRNVSGLIRTGARPEALALRFERAAVMREMSWLPLRRRPWRTHRAWDRTVPLEPFLLGDPAGEVLREIRAVAPGLFGSEPAVERSLLSRPWLKTIALLGASAILGFGVATWMLTPTGDLTLRYGEPHLCWATAAGSIAGCRLDDGRVSGYQSGTPVTCFFAEPRPTDATTYACQP